MMEMMEATREKSAGVVCLHCGIFTPLPLRTRTYSGNVASHRPQFLVVRCEECGREAPYLADEIVTVETRDRAVARAA